MKRIILLLLLLKLSSSVYSQNIISGKIFQVDGKTPLEFVNVVINTKDSVHITGTTTDINGKFKTNPLPNGNYNLKISSLGYLAQNVTLNNISQNIDLGNIILDEDSKMLNEVIVTASNTTNKVDRLVIFVTDQQKSHSSDGVNLLMTMNLPRLTINPITSSISLPGDESIQLCIDGVKVDLNSIKALKPEEVLRIEYIDNPGVRYNNASLVINYILKRANSGGIVGINTMNAFTTVFGNEQVTFKMNHKKSEFGFFYAGRFRQTKQIWSDNISEYNFVDGKKMTIFENGIPHKWKENGHTFNFNYNFLDDKNQFNATFKYGIEDVYKNPHRNRYTSLDMQRITSVNSGGKNNQKLPSLDLYYLRLLENNQTLIFNVVGTYINSDNNNTFQEKEQEKLISEIISDVDGNKYSVIGEGIYEKIFENKNRFTGGFKHTQAYANNKYKGTVNSQTKMDQSNSYLYAEYSGKANKLSYMGGIGISRAWIKQEDQKSHTDYIFRPKFTLQYNFRPELFIRLKGEIYNTTPSLSQLSNIEQYRDTFLITKGNPNLESNVNYKTGVTLSWNKRLFSIYYDASYQYSPNVIMTDTYRENNNVITTFDNQKSWQKFNTELTTNIKPIENMLTISLTGGLNKYWSFGNDYTHTNTNFYFRSALTIMYKKFMFYADAKSRYNNLLGEKFWDGEKYQTFMVNYNQGIFSIGVGIMSPFSSNNTREDKNMNRYTPSRSISYANNFSRLVIMNFSWNTSFGRKTKNVYKRINNSDNDTGIF